MFKKQLKALQTIAEENRKLHSKDKNRFTSQESYLLTDIILWLDTIELRFFSPNKEINLVDVNKLIAELKAKIKNLLKKQDLLKKHDDLEAALNDIDNFLIALTSFTVIASTPADQSQIIYIKAIKNPAYAVFIFSSNLRKFLSETEKFSIIKELSKTELFQQYEDKTIFKNFLTEFFITQKKNLTAELKEKKRALYIATLALLKEIVEVSNLAQIPDIITADVLEEISGLPNDITIESTSSAPSIEASIDLSNPISANESFEKLTEEEQIDFLLQHNFFDKNSLKQIEIHLEKIFKSPSMQILAFTTSLHFYLDLPDKMSLLLELAKSDEAFEKIKASKSIDWNNLINFANGLTGKEYRVIEAHVKTLPPKKEFLFDERFYLYDPLERIEIAEHCKVLEISIEDVVDSDQLHDIYQNQLTLLRNNKPINYERNKQLNAAQNFLYDKIEELQQQNAYQP